MGSGYRVFTAGEVLSASNVQNYLQDQAVMVFGGTAARSSAIGTANFEEGMLTYLTDVDKLQVYTGAAFADVYPAAATNQGLTLINTTSFSAVSTQSINDVFSTTYKNYKILMNITGSTTNVNVGMRLRVSAADNTTANYGQQTAESGGTTFTAVRDSGQTQWFRVAAAQTGKNQLHILDIANPFQTEITSAIGFRNRDVGTSSAETSHVSSGFVATTSFTGFTLIPTSGTITGSVSVFAYAE